MSKIFFFIILFFEVSGLAKPTKDFVGFDEPLHVTKRKLGLSETAKGNIEFSCWDYGDFAVAQINDPGTMGALEIEIRKTTLSLPKDKLCTYVTVGKGKKINDFYGYFVGSRNGFLFIDEPDIFGNHQNFQVFFEDGKKILQETRDISEPLIIKADKTAITFYKTLLVKCPLAKGEKDCWEKVIVDNKIPKTLKLQVPDCKTAFLAEKSAMDNTAQVSTKVEIADLTHPKIKFLGGIAKCNPSP